jgi:DNA polymerase III epsilon subunit-like protein
MKLLIFDTETTGLPLKKLPAEKEPGNWPHIVSISWVILDSSTNEILSQQNFIVKPLGWHVPLESTSIHGISHEIAEKTGTYLPYVISKFLTEEYDVLVAHNIDFDMNVLINAIKWDLELNVPVFPKQICTMKLSTNICKIRGNFGYKYPKLKELYFHAFNKYPFEAKLHNSMYDVLILTELVQKYEPLRKLMDLHTISV